MCKENLQYLKKCLASSGEVTILDKATNQVSTYTTQNGKLIMNTSNGKVDGKDATVSFFTLSKNPENEIKVSKEGDHCINTNFLAYLDQEEKNWNNNF